jgi:hypothetical protein
LLYPRMRADAVLGLDAGRSLLVVLKRDEFSLNRFGIPKSVGF